MTEIKLNRWPAVQFLPKNPCLGDEISLEINITAQDIGMPLNILVNKTEEKVPIITTIDPGEFEIIVPNNRFHGTIYVPIQDKDSDPILFLLRSTKEGVQNVYVRFFQSGTYLGRTKVQIIVSSNQSKKSLSTSQESHLLSPSVDINVRPDGSITMLIIDKRDITDSAPGMQYKILLLPSIRSILDEYIDIREPLKFLQDPQSIFQTFFTKIESLPPNEADDIIRTEGRNYFQDLFPDELKFKYFQYENDITSIKVISDEPWIPWELVRPWSMFESWSQYRVAGRRTQRHDR